MSGVPQGSLLTLCVIEIITHAAWSTRSDYAVWVANATFPSHDYKHSNASARLATLVCCFYAA